jgi:hypothetical protein
MKHLVDYETKTAAELMRLASRFTALPNDLRAALEARAAVVESDLLVPDVLADEVDEDPPASVAPPAPAAKRK